VDDLVQVQVVHAPGDAHGPVHEQGGHDLAAGAEHLVQLALGAVLHQDAVAGGLGTDAPGRERERERRHPQSEMTLYDRCSVDVKRASGQNPVRAEGGLERERGKGI